MMTTANFQTDNQAQTFDAAVRASLALDFSPEDLFEAEAWYQMMLGTIPDLTDYCMDIARICLESQENLSAIQFIQAMKKVPLFSTVDASSFLQNPKTNHVLIHNDLLKVVLIHWKPGKVSSIHGHAKGGCVFKVLMGSLEEKRFHLTADQEMCAHSHFQAGAMAYIDDDMALHQVGNPYRMPAISIHAYTPGK